MTNGRLASSEAVDEVVADDAGSVDDGEALGSAELAVEADDDVSGAFEDSELDSTLDFEASDGVEALLDEAFSFEELEMLDASLEAFFDEELEEAALLEPVLLSEALDALDDEGLDELLGSVVWLAFEALDDVDGSTDELGSEALEGVDDEVLEDDLLAAEEALEELGVLWELGSDALDEDDGVAELELDAWLLEDEDDGVDGFDGVTSLLRPTTLISASTPMPSQLLVNCQTATPTADGK